MLTNFGKLCRKLRIDNNQVLYDMASLLGVAPSFLSSVENGKKNVPVAWCNILREEYELEESQYNELVMAKEMSKTQVKINLAECEGEQRELAFSFARKFENLSNEQKNKILQILDE